MLTCLYLTYSQLLFTNKQIRQGQLGQGGRHHGAYVTGDELPFIDLGTGRSAKAVAAGFWHTCVLLDNNQVKCFGWNE